MNLSIMHKGARNVYSIHRSDWQVSLCISVFQAILVLESSLEGTLLLSIEVDGHFPGNPHPAESSRQREARRCGPCSPLGIPTAHSAGWRIMPVVHNPLWPVGAQHLYQKHLKRKYNTWHDL